MRRVVVLALTLACCIGGGLSAQQASPTPIRDAAARIRVTVPSGNDQGFVGWIEHVDDKTLTLAPERGPHLTLDRATISRIERPDGKRSRAAQIFWGALIGMAGGYGASKSTYDACGSSTYLCELDNVEHRFFAMTAGAVAGGVIGGFAVPTQRWKKVPLSSLDAPARE